MLRNQRAFRLARVTAGAGFVAIFLAFASAPVLAQEPLSPGGAMRGHGAGMEPGGMGHDMKGMGGMEHGGGGMMQHMLCGPTEHLDGKLAYLKTELKLSEQQQAAWNAFADAYRAAMQKAAKACAPTGEGGEHRDHGILGQLGMMEHHMVDHLELVRGAKAAIEPFYASLTEEQRKIADHAMASVLGLGMGGMGGGGMGGMSH